MAYDPWRSRVRKYSHLGLQLGLAYCALAAVGIVVRILAIVPLGSTDRSWILLLALPYYPFAGVAAGAVVGLLAPLGRGYISRALVGMLAAVPVVIGALPFILDDGPVPHLAIFLAVMAALFGTIGSIAFWIALGD